MKKLKRIKLSNINDSQLEKEQLIHLKGGAMDKTCGEKCTDEGCVGTANYFEVGLSLKS